MQKKNQMMKGDYSECKYGTVKFRLNKNSYTVYLHSILNKIYVLIYGRGDTPIYFLVWGVGTFGNLAYPKKTNIESALNSPSRADSSKVARNGRMKNVFKLTQSSQLYQQPSRNCDVKCRSVGVLCSKINIKCIEIN